MTSTNQLSKCGFCSVSFTKIQLANQKFEMRCFVCKKDHLIHKKCSLKLLNVHEKNTKQKLSKNHSILNHNKNLVNMKLYCKDCEQNCFLCGNKHQCKLICIKNIQKCIHDLILLIFILFLLQFKHQIPFI